MVSGEVCFSGSLPEKPDQDLWLWDVLPQDGLSTWTFSVTGVPNATTSVHVIRITSSPGVYPVTTAGDAARVDSELDGITAGVLPDIQLPVGRYLLGVSRADPVGGREITDDRQYEFSIVRHLDLPPVGDLEPNESSATASPVTGGFAVSGDLQGSIDEYRWSLSGADAARSWRLEAQTGLRQAMVLSLSSTSGAVMASGMLSDGGVSRIHDLRLPAGDYVDLGGPCRHGGTAICPASSGGHRSAGRSRAQRRS